MDLAICGLWETLIGFILKYHSERPGPILVETITHSIGNAEFGKIEVNTFGVARDGLHIVPKQPIEPD